MRTVFYFLLLLPLSLACTLAGVVKKAAESQGPFTLTSSDSKTQLTLPGGWREEKQLNDIAVLQAAHSFEEMYIVVVRANKQDYADDITLKDFVELTRTDVIANLQEPQSTDPVATKVADYPAMEYRLDGIVDKIKIRYIYTVVERSNYYYQIITWTLPSHFDRNQTTLRQVTQSFRELKSD
ncbi:MAG: hypothetical protein AABN95_13685 [Acidobacteriota bacterium]